VHSLLWRRVFLPLRDGVSVMTNLLVRSLTTKDVMTRFLALSQNDIRDFGCEVVRESAKRITVLEPVSYKVPSIARPYCCYINTVIFYLYPYQVARDSHGYLEWDRVDTLLSWESEILFEGQIYVVGGGRVIRHRKSWWMKRWARLKGE
jgi:hypothetical protein